MRNRAPLNEAAAPGARARPEVRSPLQGTLPERSGQFRLRGGQVGALLRVGVQVVQFFTAAVAGEQRVLVAPRAHRDPAARALAVVDHVVAAPGGEVAVGAAEQALAGQRPLVNGVVQPQLRHQRGQHVRQPDRVVAFVAGVRPSSVLANLSSSGTRTEGS